MKTKGFTLLELLVVVALLALLAGVALMAMDRTDTEVRDDLARIEMNEIRKALRMFYRDVGHFPDAASSVAEDLRVSLLLACDEPSDVGCTDWDPDAKRGWNGPYLSSEGGKDPWGKNYRLKAPNDPANTSLVSDGSDKVTGTADDIEIFLLK